MPDINCALGISQLKKINKFINARIKIAKFYNSLFSDANKFIIPKRIKNNKNSFHLYPLLVRLDKIKKSKETIIKEFLKKKLNCKYIIFQ